jgi:hypothetical protein
MLLTKLYPSMSLFEVKFQNLGNPSIGKSEKFQFFSLQNSSRQFFLSAIFGVCCQQVNLTDGKVGGLAML